MHGQTNHPDPGRFAVEIDIMQEMGWSWRELCEAPVALLDELMERLQARRYWTGVKEKQNKAKARSKHG